MFGHLRRDFGCFDQIEATTSPWKSEKSITMCVKLEFQGTALPPEQLAWCGMDSVLLYWDDMLLMVGPYGDPVCNLYDEPIILIPECDGVRILSNTSMEFLQRVPDSTVSIFKIGSTLPAALLYDALDHFDRRSAKADENLRLIRSSLPEAVEACIDAAGHEFDVSRQRTLLRAASYGQAFSRLVRILFQYFKCSDEKSE
ncbi:hypothetical protein RHGRI_006901 [Rhododendron griersonianum]|uniref:Vps16 N-terminal domain-containing protein n=1 Tax=Rhododendron griersonianum TaxID=479676 RepID=A0AAV6KUX3_9ERIC|nr:hypothetical protein RHGRI_006901 [Rhododendron griersonianum]